MSSSLSEWLDSTYQKAADKNGERRDAFRRSSGDALQPLYAPQHATAASGGNGYAEEFEISRVLCDARILNIFEGAAEIQAHVIARGLLERRN